MSDETDDTQAQDDPTAADLASRGKAAAQAAPQRARSPECLQSGRTGHSSLDALTALRARRTAEQIKRAELAQAAVATPIIANADIVVAASAAPVATKSAPSKYLPGLTRPKATSPTTLKADVPPRPMTKFHRKVTVRVHAIALTRENVREAIALIRSQSPNMMVFNGPAGISVNCKGVPLISWGQYLVCEPDGVFRAMDREAFRNTYVEGWNGRDSK